MKTYQWMGLLMALGGAVIAEAKDPVVHLHESFESHPEGTLSAIAPLYRVSQVEIIDGKGRLGSGKVAHFHDQKNTLGGALEFNVGAAPVGSMFIEFDLLNNAPGVSMEKMPVIFGVGPWSTSHSMLLNANARRAFGVEFYQNDSHKAVILRVGQSIQTYDFYDMEKPQHLKIWVNDHDTNKLAYKRPDTGETAELDPNAVAVWINDVLIGATGSYGVPMQASVTAGDCGLGRVGFGSTTSNRVDFLIDNLHVEDPTGESKPVAADSTR